MWLQEVSELDEPSCAALAGRLLEAFSSESYVCDQLVHNIPTNLDIEDVGNAWNLDNDVHTFQDTGPRETILDGTDDYHENENENENENDDHSHDDNNELAFEYTEDHVSNLFELEDALLPLFPKLTFSTPFLYEMLMQAHFDMNTAWNLIIGMQQMVQNCRPCRHMMTSRCMRTDCTFDHDLASIPCRYWMTGGGCINMENGLCPFMHCVPESLQTISNTSYLHPVGSSGTPENGAFAEEEFPELGAAQKSQVGRSDQATGSPAGYSYANAAITGASVVQSDLRQSTRSQSAYDAYSYTGMSAGGGRAQPSAKMSESDWVDSELSYSGRSLAQEYKVLRAEAAKLASVRNKLLEEVMSHLSSYLFAELFYH
jgi:hypothetical protein